MEFYVLDEIREGQIKSTGIGIDSMVKVLKSIEKQQKAKTIDELEPYNIVYLESAQFVENTDVVFSGKIKKEEFALIKTGKTFEIEQSGTQFFVQLANGKLNIAKDIMQLEKNTVNSQLTTYSDIEKQAYNWLEKGKTGLSSLVLCQTLLPNIQHDKLEKLDNSYSSSYPHDTSDFNRCLGLLEAVPELRKDLEKLKVINKQWDNLVQKWSEIEMLIKENKVEDANKIINQCVNVPKMKKI